MSRETVEETSGGPRAEAKVPGLVLVLSAGQPTCRAVRLGTGFHVGRDIAAFESDERLSRRHLRIEPAGSKLRVLDLGSRNGTYVDGARIEGEVVGDAIRVVRAGRSLLVPVDDVRPYESRTVKCDDGIVVGPALAATFDAVSRAAAVASTLLVRGESGSGKERVARAFHALGPAAGGPFVAVNCATLPEGVAERLLFGARKGAYSGATDTEGLVRAAHGGALFLDEIGELEPDVQAKLLRVLETREVLPLGANKPTRVDIRFVFATHRELRTQAADGEFRADLFYRIEQPSVLVPPLRACPEEVAFLATAELARNGKPLPLHVGFVEACLLRPWPGNVRELLRHVRSAHDAATLAAATELFAEHLDPQAGMPLSRSADGLRESSPGRDLDEAALREALRSHDGNVSAAARSLGLHRTQLRRLMERAGIERP